MKYRIIIQRIDQNLVQLVLISRFKLLWLFPIWVEETSRIGTVDTIFDWVGFYADLYNIEASDITDLTEVVS